MTITAPKRARSGLALMLAAAFALVLLVGGPSGAAPQDANFGVQSGSLSVGASTFTLDPADGGGFTGTYDDDTGALTGTLLLPPIVTELNVTDPPVGIVDVVITITQDGPGTGSIDPDTGAATFDATVTLGIAASLAGTPVTPEGCRITPVDLTFEGTYDETTMVLSLSDEGFVLPPSTGCEAAGPLIDGALTGDTSAVLELISTDEPITPITTTTTTTTTTGLLYENCDAARAAGAAPVYRDDPGYGPHLDANNDGVGCETPGGAARPITTTARFTG